MPYANEKDEATARKLGYTVSRDQVIGSTFDNGKRRVWGTRIGWQTADLVKGSYRNHEIFNKLSDALRRPL